MIFQPSFQEKPQPRPNYKNSVFFRLCATWEPLLTNKQSIYRYWLHLVARNHNGCIAKCNL